MSRKSNHHESVPEKRSAKFARNFLSFFVFVFVVIFSISTCTAVMFLNAERVSSIFTNDDYVTSLKQDVVVYAHDMCDECSIPYDSVDETLTYDAIFDIAVSYAKGNLCKDDMYTDTTFLTKIEELQNSLTQSTNSMLKDYRLKGDTADIETFSSHICEYIKEKTAFPYIDYVKTATNISIPVSVAGCVVSLVFITVFSMVIIYSAKRKYRGVRALAYSFEASALFQISMIIAIEVIKLFKTLLIYPTYLCESVMSFLGKCELTLAASSFISFMIALIVMAIVWRMKRDER